MVTLLAVVIKVSRNSQVTCTSFRRLEEKRTNNFGIIVTKHQNIISSAESLFTIQISPTLCSILLFLFFFEMHKQTGMQLSPVPNCRKIAWRLQGRLQSAMTSVSIREGHTPGVNIRRSRRMVFRLTLEQRGSMQNGHSFAPRDVSLLKRCRVIPELSSSPSSSSCLQVLPVKRNENRRR